jgi:hypothetical protein
MDEFAKQFPERREAKEWLAAEAAEKAAKSRAAIEEAAARKSARARAVAAKLAAKKRSVRALTDQEAWNQGLLELRPVGKSKHPTHSAESSSTNFFHRQDRGGAVAEEQAATFGPWGRGGQEDHQSKAR